MKKYLMRHGWHTPEGYRYWETDYDNLPPLYGEIVKELGSKEVELPGEE